MLEGVQRLGKQRLLLPSCATEIKINSLEKTIELTQHVLCATKKTPNLYLYFAYNFQKCSQVHTTASGNKLIFHIEHLLSFLNYILTLNFNGLIMCTLPLHTKRNSLAKY